MVSLYLIFKTDGYGIMRIEKEWGEENEAIYYLRSD